MSRYLKIVSPLAGLVITCSLTSMPALASDAKVVKIFLGSDSGEAFFTPPGASKVKIVKEGQLVPEKSLIETGVNIEVYVETFAGAVATVRQNTQVVLEEVSSGSRRARLNLKSGNVVSALDPTKRASTDFGIVTPTGVAAARGTVYSVSVIPAGGGSNTAVATLSGVVRITRTDGSSFDLPYGQGATNAASAVTLGTMLAADPSLRDDVMAAVRVVALNVSSSTSAAGVAGETANELAYVTEAAVRALPAQSGALVHSTIEAAVSAGSVTSGSPDAMSNALSKIVGAAVKAAVSTNPEQISNITRAAASAVTAAISVSGATDASLSAAVAAVTTAAVGAAPNLAAAAAQGAAHGVVNAKITEAVNAAKASSPNISSEQLTAIANRASISAGATAAVTTIATTAITAQIAATGQGASANISAAGAQIIATAVNTGSSNGAAIGVGSSIGAPPGAISSPQVSVNLSVGNAGTSVTTTATGGQSMISTSQTVSGEILGRVSTSISGSGGSNNIVSNLPTIVPNLDQTQEVASPR